MKRIFVIVIIITLLGCNTNNETDIDDSYDYFGLSTKVLNITNRGCDTTVLTNNPLWRFILAVESDDLLYPSDSRDIFSGSWYIIEKYENEIRIKLEGNQTGKQRTLKIGLQRMDHFDTLVINQENR